MSNKPEDSVINYRSQAIRKDREAELEQQLNELKKPVPVWSNPPRFEWLSDNLRDILWIGVAPLVIAVCVGVIASIFGKPGAFIRASVCIEVPALLIAIGWRKGENAVLATMFIGVFSMLFIFIAWLVGFWAVTGRAAI